MDIATIWNELSASGSYAIANGQLQADEGLKTAVIISLFTDRRAALDDELPSPTSGRKGWWGGEYLSREIGSRLWLLAREKQRVRVLERAKEYALEALGWLVDDGIAKAVEAEATVPAMGVLLLEIVIHKPNGDLSNFRFQYLWNGLLVSDGSGAAASAGDGFIYDGSAAYDGTHDYSGIL